MPCHDFLLGIRELRGGFFGRDRAARDERVAPVQFMDIAECEILEEYLQTGTDIVEIFEQKTQRPLEQGESCQNFFILRLPTAEKPTNRYLSSRYEELSAAALRFFRTRRNTTKTSL